MPNPWFSRASACIQANKPAFPLDVLDVPPVRESNYSFVSQGVEIPALATYATGESFRTVLQKDGVRVETVEHLLAALMCCSIPYARITVEGPEIPILDGSAREFVHRLVNLSRKEDIPTEESIVIRQPVEVRNERGFARLEPAPKLTFSLSFSAETPLLGGRTLHQDFESENWREKIAPARTYGLREHESSLRNLGLIQGVSLENCLVFRQGKVENPEGMRGTNEHLRHKLLDALGDLALAGRPVVGRFASLNPGHARTQSLVRKLLQHLA